MERIDLGLAGLGWDATWDDVFEPHAAVGFVPGRVVEVHRETSIVATGDGEAPAGVTGRFRAAATTRSDFPAVGDWVALDLEPDPPVIEAVLPRRTSFRRSAADSGRRGGGRTTDEQVIAANVDLALLVAGLDRDFNVRRMERYLAVAASSGVAPLIVLNKADVARDLDHRMAAIEAIAPDVPVVVLSAMANAGVAALDAHVRDGMTAVILGSSGVGKSTLVNALLGEDRQATAAVRESDSRGRHTTTHRELFRLPSGALLIDTPGIRSLEVVGAETGVDVTFDDVEAVATTCRFSDCRHDGEPGCAVTAAIEDGRLTAERVAGHRKLEDEIAAAARRDDPQSRADERRRSKMIHRAVGRRQAEKQGDDR